MAVFKYDTCGKLREIFSEHCNLSVEQYEWISGEFIDLVTDIQEKELKMAIIDRTDKMNTVFEFLLETKELTLEEYNALCNLVSDVCKAAVYAGAMEE